MKRLLAFIAILALTACAGTGSGPASIKEERVSYTDGTTPMNGIIVYDESRKDRRPGVMVIHEWWGITQHVRDEARKFAEQGYTAFVVDMFGGKTADNPKDAGMLSGSVMKDRAAMESRFNAARVALAKHPTVDGSRIAAAGYCFGGTVALNMARAGADLKAIAAFHAGLGTNTPLPAQIRPKILVLNGAADPFIKPDQIETFKKDMATAKADYRFINYPGAVHAYTNPEATAKGKQFNLPLAYHPEVNRQAKTEAARFFAEALR